MDSLSGSKFYVSFLEIPNQCVLSQAVALVEASKSPENKTKQMNKKPPYLDSLIFKARQNDDLLFCLMLASQRLVPALLHRASPCGLSDQTR